MRARVCAWVHRYAWRLLGVALAVFGGGVSVFVAGWPAWRPDWDVYIYAWVVGAAVMVTGGLTATGLVLEFRRYARRFDEAAARIRQAQALDATKEAQSETALDVLLGEKWEQRGLTVRQHYTGGVYGPGNDGRRSRAGVGQ